MSSHDHLGGPPSSRRAAWERVQAGAKARDERLQTEAAERARAAEDAIRAGWTALAIRAEHGDVQAMRDLCDSLARHHGIRIIDDPGYDSTACFRHESRTAFVPPIDDLESFAVCLHELGHGLAGPCPMTGDHFTTIVGGTIVGGVHVGGSAACQRCEVDAWTEAMRLVSFTREMFDRVRRSLSSYRSALATRAARTALAQTVSPLTHMQSRQHHLTHRDRLARQARVEAEVAAEKTRSQSHAG
jgi:hypothetical protein